MDVSVGARLGPYEITGRIGSGGMGEVFRARDTRLGRSVAIKVLPAEFAGNARLRLRFEREARAVSQLNHPNICTLFDVGDGYLVMELLEGETLADRIVRGALSVAEVLRIGTQIAAALDRAHRSGIVHRDLKPSNIMLTKGGAKLLDFGLAKNDVVDVRTDDTTEPRPLTQEGAILGTFQYMAPEQLEGQEADARADIFAFGAVLYEMATGRRAFSGKTKASLIAAIVAAEPTPMSELQPLTPHALERLVRSCMAKDREDRIQTAHDVGLELRWIAETPSQPSIAPPRRRWETYAWPIAVVAIAAAAWFAGTHLRPRNLPATVYRTAINTPEGSPLELYSGRMALSPDGSTLAAVGISPNGTPILMIRKLSDEAWRTLDGTEGAYDPFWSPDGKELGFSVLQGIRRIAADGSNRSALIAKVSPARAAAWNADGTIVFSNYPKGLCRVSASGGEPSLLIATPRAVNLLSAPQFLPDQRHFLYTAWDFARLDHPSTWLGTIDGSSKPRQVIADGGNAQYANGNVVYARESVLYAQPFDAEKMTAGGPPRAVGSVQFVRTPFPIAYFAVSEHELVCLPAGSEAQTQLTRVDRAGKVLGTIGSPGFISFPRLSHSGTRIAVDISDSEAIGDVWLIDTASGAPTRFAFDTANESVPVWSPADESITYTEDRETTSVIMTRPLAGGAPRSLTEQLNFYATPSDWSPDGKQLLMTGGSTPDTNNIYVYSPADRKLTLLVKSSRFDNAPRFSPDGRWFAYDSVERGEREVFAQPFPPNGSKWQISVNGGQTPVWSRDGKSLYFQDLTNRLNESAVSTANGFAAQPPRPLFAIRGRGGDLGIAQFDVASDGTFIVDAIPDNATSSMTLIVNWRETLAK